MDSTSSKTFTVLPMGQNISLTPGTTYEGEISIAIPSDATESFSYEVTVAPYSVVDDEYTADLISTGAYTQIVDWITIDEPTGTIAPNGTKKIYFSINVPEDAPVGGQYASLLVGQNPDTLENQGISIQNLMQIASVIYANVEGEIVTGGEILENTMPGFSFVNSISTEAILKNDGNSHSIASFNIKVTNFFTGEVIFPKDNEEGIFTEVIMPETTRTISREIDNLPVLGLVNVSQKITFEGETVENVTNVLICPIWFLALVFLSICSIIWFILSRIKARKKRSSLVY